jgi:hypothetical protein
MVYVVVSTWRPDVLLRLTTSCILVLNRVQFDAFRANLLTKNCEYYVVPCQFATSNNNLENN